MRWLRSIRMRLRSLVRQTRVDQELDAELDFYVEQTTRNYVAQGMASEEARALARRTLGSAALVRERGARAAACRSCNSLMNAGSMYAWPCGRSPGVPGLRARLS